jgi:hypothetical protein
MPPIMKKQFYLSVPVTHGMTFPSYHQPILIEFLSYDTSMVQDGIRT